MHLLPRESSWPDNQKLHTKSSDYHCSLDPSGLVQVPSSYYISFRFQLVRVDLPFPTLSLKAQLKLSCLQRFLIKSQVPVLGSLPLHCFSGLLTLVSFCQIPLLTVPTSTSFISSAQGDVFSKILQNGNLSSDLYTGFALCTLTFPCSGGWKLLLISPVFLHCAGVGSYGLNFSFHGVSCFLK